MNLLDKLPKELVDYIYSYDDNVYWKSIYNKNTRVIELARSKNIYITYLSNMYNYHNIYKSRQPQMLNIGLNTSGYILRHQKNYGDNLIHVDSISLEVKPSKLVLVRLKNPIYKE